MAVALGVSLATLHVRHPVLGLSLGDPDGCVSSSDVERIRCEQAAAERASGTLRASRAYHARLADRLAADGGGRNLALATNLRAMSLAGESYVTASTSSLLAGDTRLAAWRDGAVREGRDDPFVYSLLLRTLSPDDDARQRGVRDAWRTLEPANLASLPDHDAAGALALLASTREASRFDIHFGTLLRSTIAAVERHPPNAREARWLLNAETPTERAYAISLAFAMLELPLFTPVVDACKGDALLQPGRREACVRCGDVLADASDTLIAHMIGLAILRNVAQSGAARERIEERRRRAAWLQEQWHELGEADPAGIADGQTGVLRASPDIGEMDLMRKVLGANGIPVEPPPEYRHVPMLSM